MENRGLSVAALVLGIVSVVFMCNMVIAVPCGVLAVIFGVMQMKKGQDSMAKAGFITGIVGLSVPGVIILLSIFDLITVFSVWL